MHPRAGHPRPDRTAYDPVVGNSDWEPAREPPSRPVSSIGSLGRALVRVQARVQTLTLLVTTVVAIIVVATVLPALAVPLGDRFGYSVALVVLGVIS
jgi:hypothetical protein